MIVAGQGREKVRLTRPQTRDIVNKNNTYNTVAYRAYIKQDYKAVIVWEPERTEAWHRLRVWALCVCTAGAVYTYTRYNAAVYDDAVSLQSEPQATLFQTPPAPAGLSHQHLSTSHGSVENTLSDGSRALASAEQAVAGRLPEEFESGSVSPAISPKIGGETTKSHPPERGSWQTVTVRSGDNMSLIFSRLKLNPADLHSIVELGDATQALKRLQPGQDLRLLVDGSDLLELLHEIDPTRTLHVRYGPHGFEAQTIVTNLTTRLRAVEATIESSLFLAGQEIGLSDQLILQLVDIYGWDIDFALDIHKGDRFRVIYEELYRDGVKVKDGTILAAEFFHRGQSLKAVRYAHADGRADYYSETGTSMRKAFLRTPVEFNRISSTFNLRRYHPILNRIRAHKGVDYAAPAGTPVRATGDGRVVHMGYKGGYGNTIVLQHGSTYSTLYGHLSRYGRGLKHDARVTQGQVIGYVGMTGLATGPHLHYEFRVNGVHKNPLTIELPKAAHIPREQMADFEQQTRPWLIQLASLDNFHENGIAGTGIPRGPAIAMQEQSGNNATH
jgi:murein DD-endopeptidase MepM/ murein hydrolase activator NlpD